MAAPTPPRPSDQQLLQELAGYSESERAFLDRQAAADQALLADLLASDDEPAPPRC